MTFGPSKNESEIYCAVLDSLEMIGGMEMDWKFWAAAAWSKVVVVKLKIRRGSENFIM